MLIDYLSKFPDYYYDFESQSCSSAASSSKHYSIKFALPRLFELELRWTEIFTLFAMLRIMGSTLCKNQNRGCQIYHHNIVPYRSRRRLSNQTDICGLPGLVFRARRDMGYSQLSLIYVAAEKGYLGGSTGRFGRMEPVRMKPSRRCFLSKNWPELVKKLRDQ